MSPSAGVLPDAQIEAGEQALPQRSMSVLQDNLRSMRKRMRRSSTLVQI
jgi:hypothetical protein